MDQSVPRHTRMALCLATGLLPAASFPFAAAARGFVSFGFGVPLIVGPPVYYAPPPAYYVPPPAYVAPAAPGYLSPPAATSQPSQRACHEYQTMATIDGKAQPVIGTACQQADGTWRTNQ